MKEKFNRLFDFALDNFTTQELERLQFKLDVALRERDLIEQELKKEEYND